MNHRRLIRCALILALTLAAGCATPLTRVKETFKEGAAVGFDRAQLDEMQGALGSAGCRRRRRCEAGLARWR